MTDFDTYHCNNDSKKTVGEYAECCWWKSTIGGVRGGFKFSGHDKFLHVSPGEVRDEEAGESERKLDSLLKKIRVVVGCKCRHWWFCMFYIDGWWVELVIWNEWFRLVAFFWIFEEEFLWVRIHFKSYWQHFWQSRFQIEATSGLQEAPVGSILFQKPFSLSNKNQCHFVTQEYHDRNRQGSPIMPKEMHTLILISMLLHHKVNFHD